MCASGLRVITGTAVPDAADAGADGSAGPEDCADDGCSADEPPSPGGAHGRAGDIDCRDEHVFEPAHLALVRGVVHVYYLQVMATLATFVAAHDTHRPAGARRRWFTTVGWLRGAYDPPTTCDDVTTTCRRPADDLPTGGGDGMTATGRRWGDDPGDDTG
eukprot:gene920-9537_t